MARKEEIEMVWFAKACQSNHRYDEKTFREAVEWADKTMIEKVSKWLKEEFYTITNRNGYEDLVSASCDNVNELIEELKKAMEE